VDVTIDNESVLADLPRQRDGDGEAAYRAALAELAAVASAQVSRRDEVRTEVHEERIVVDAQQERTRSAWRGVGIALLVVAIVACAATIILTLPKKPHAKTGQDTVPAASLSTGRALGGSAHTRLGSQGTVVTTASCLAAYAADAAASPLLLPSPARPSVIRDNYVAACLGS
jgi:hypothetical protein